MLPHVSKGMPSLETFISGRPPKPQTPAEMFALLSAALAPAAPIPPATPS